MADIQLEDLTGIECIVNGDLGVWGTKNNNIHNIHKDKINELVVATNTINGVTTGLGVKADLVNGKVPLSQMDDSLVGAVEYKGAWDATINTPMLPSIPTEKGIYYVVSVAGAQFGLTFGIGDWIISNGTVWQKVDNFVTKEEIGLGSVDNTSDENKPISTATQTELNNKLNKSTYTGTAQDLKNDIDFLKLNWYDVFEKTKLKNNENCFLKKIDENNFAIYINMYKNVFQRWEFTRINGLDNSVPTVTNGNPWQVDIVSNVRLGVVELIDITSLELTKSGTWATYSPFITSNSTGSYVEATVKGTEIFLRTMYKNDTGILALYVDNMYVKDIDLYSSSSGGQAITLKIAENLTDSDHKIKIVVTGTKNPLSSGNYIRFAYYNGISGSNLVENISSLSEQSENMKSNRNYRYGQSAIELAVNTTYNGKSVWSGTYHKHLYPKILNNQKIFIDGIERNISYFTTGVYFNFLDLKITQELELSNSIESLADVNFFQQFNKEGYHVKWKLKWTKAVYINTFYSAMCGTSVDNLFFGNSNDLWIANFNDAEKGNYDAYNFIGWQSQDDYLVSMKVLNENIMKFNNVSKKMYFRDRTTDAKVYLPRFRGQIEVGDVFNSDFVISISHCNNVNFIMNNI